MSNRLPTSAEEITVSGRYPRRERRQLERFKVRLPVRIRPLYLEEQPLEEVTNTLNLNRHGLCFTSGRDHYYIGMPLFLKFSYSPATLVRKEYFGEVVRLDQLPNGGQAIAVKFLS